MVEQVGIIDHGRMLFEGPLTELQRHSKGALTLRLLHPAKALPVLQANGLPTAAVGADNTIALPPLRDDLLAGLVQALADSGAGVVGLTTQHTRTLEEIFLTLTAPKEVG